MGMGVLGGYTYPNIYFACLRLQGQEQPVKHLYGWIRESGENWEAKRTSPCFSVIHK
jgi:hypothetical protein